VIENMPILEAVPDESQMMRYKLITLTGRPEFIPIIQVVPSGTITLISEGQRATLEPSTANAAQANAQLGFTATISDTTVADIEVVRAAPSAAQATTPSFIGEGNLPLSKTVVGMTFRVVAKANTTSANKSAVVTIFGNATGGYETVSIVVVPTVLQTSFNTAPGGINPGSGLEIA
jgi:hypothetical protein